MTRDTELNGLLRRFAALPREDRDHVLGMLGQADREALRLVLSEDEGTSLSAALAGLVDRCRSDSPPQELTKRAAQALLAAVDAATSSDPIELALRRSVPQRRGWSRWLGAEAFST